MPRYALHRYGTFRYGDYPLVGKKGKMALAPGLRIRQVRSPVWTTSQKIWIEALADRVRIRPLDGDWVETRQAEVNAMTSKVRVRATGGEWVVGVNQRLEEEQ